MKLIKSLFSALLVIFSSSAAMADQPRPWQMYFQEPASPVMKQLVHLHDGLVVMCFVVTAFVLMLLLYTSGLP